MKNKVEDLRDHLFETLEALKNKDEPMEIERAQAIAQVAQVIVNSAKVENDRMKITGQTQAASQFIAAPELPAPKPGQPRLVNGKAQSGSA